MGIHRYSLSNDDSPKHYRGDAAKDEEADVHLSRGGLGGYQDRKDDGEGDKERDENRDPVDHKPK